jgi:hypothetical protein
MLSPSPRRLSVYVPRDTNALNPFGTQTFIGFTDQIRRAAVVPITFSDANSNSVPGYSKRYLAHDMEELKTVSLDNHVPVSLWGRYHHIKRTIRWPSTSSKRMDCPSKNLICQFSRVRKNYENYVSLVMSIFPSVRPRGTTWLLMDGF